MSLGIKNTAFIDDESIKFADNIVTAYDRLDEKNLVCCLFLNLRHSSIGTIDFNYLT